MEMARFVQSLESDLAAVAAVGDEQTRAAAERVLQAIRGSAGLRLLDVLGEAALELNAQLPDGHVEVRLAGQDPALVYVGEEEAPPEPAADDGLTARITLRLPELAQAVDRGGGRTRRNFREQLARPRPFAGRGRAGTKVRQTAPGLRPELRRRESQMATKFYPLPFGHVGSARRFQAGEAARPRRRR